MMTVLCDIDSVNGKSGVGEEGSRVLEMGAAPSLGVASREDSEGRDV